ncbi:UbiA prenyltransferase family-domain-containing protein [Fomitopsis serialis]|uniref:UbiA prenyltransferase family-domain-containing protein n=1 Tax=Fomitopsis serialis TaxID=139415 RepID=UPI0020076AE6|nr:UbiA prenyltransferase family-domain-containing protein [Neoantrodia serialis]KAH9934290.1 UbiA prenyltransferase family-domain-containing protein [Neoantrodia serialis]
MLFLGIVGRGLHRAAYTLCTLFLFTKSDIKTTVISVVHVLRDFCCSSTRISTHPHSVFWIWIHLLQFDVSNQTLKPEEDLLNKSDRPLPSGRMTLEAALVLRWALVPLCLAVSWLYSTEVLWASVALVALTIIYNELSAHGKGWIIRNLVNAAGFASFEVGATLVATHGHKDFDWIARSAVYASAGIFASTIHTQDFKDVLGDSSVGRRAIPIVFPRIARITPLIGLLFWTISLTVVWVVDWGTSAVLFTIALNVGYRFLRLRTMHEDQVSFYWYNVWLSFAHALPGYCRMFYGA